MGTNTITGPWAGNILRANNDDTAHYSQGKKEPKHAIYVEMLSLEPGKRIKDLKAALERKKDGQDQIVFLVSGSNPEQYGIATADELTNIKDVHEGDIIHINGTRAKVVLVNDENEDGVGPVLRAIRHSVAALVALKMSTVFFAVPEPTGLTKFYGMGFALGAANQGKKVFETLLLTDRDRYPTRALENIASPVEGSGFTLRGAPSAKKKRW